MTNQDQIKSKRKAHCALLTNLRYSGSFGHLKAVFIFGLEQKRQIVVLDSGAHVAVAEDV